MAPGGFFEQSGSFLRKDGTLIDGASIVVCCFFIVLCCLSIVLCCFTIVLCCFTIVLCCFLSLYAVFLSLYAVFAIGTRWNTGTWDKCAGGQLWQSVPRATSERDSDGEISIEFVCRTQPAAGYCRLNTSDCARTPDLPTARKHVQPLSSLA